MVPSRKFDLGGGGGGEGEPGQWRKCQVKLYVVVLDDPYFY